MTAKETRTLRRTLQGTLIRIGQGLLVLIVATTFSLLALWQWDRAEGHQELEAELSRIATSAPASLTSIHRPQIALDGEDANRMVTTSGRYLDAYLARGQEAGEYEVALLEVKGSAPRAAILVARSILDYSATNVPLGEEVELLARLLPSQREDLDPNSRISGEGLSRIDSALLVERLQDNGLALYDGFLLLQSERIDGVESDLELIPDSIAEPTIPGYYWQHLSYVVIWSLMAILTLYLPFYQRKRNRLVP